MIYKYLGIIILIIIVLFIFNYYLNNNKETFRSNNIYSKQFITENCKDNYAKLNNLSDKKCINEAWVTNPRLLCAICGDNDIPLKYMNIPSKINQDTYYGCLENQPNSLGLNWNIPINNNKVGEADSFLGDIMTCNKTNKESLSGLYLIISSTVVPNIYINGKKGKKINIDYLENSFYYCYYYENIKYNTHVSIDINSMNNSACISISYFWNKQLFILDNNGYEFCCNIINYIVKGEYQWANESDSSDLKPILPWMKNWFMINSKTFLLDFKIGQNQHIGKMNNDLVLWVGITNFGEVIYNNNKIYGNINNVWGNEIREIIIKNVKNSDSLKFKTKSGGFLGTSLSVSFIYHSLFFTFESDLDNFNNVINILPSNNYGVIDFYKNKIYCDLPIIYRGQGECDGCSESSLCLIEKNYFKICDFKRPINNLFFNKKWIANYNYELPKCGCMCSCSTNIDQNCCINGYYCNQYSTLSYEVIINDNILISPINNYV